MTLPALLAKHVHVSEREVAHTWPDGQKDDSHWEDCLWTSLVEFLNDTYIDQPDTLARAEALRDASGEPPSGGSNFDNVAAAFAKLGTKITVTPLAFIGFWNALKPGTGAVATGNMGNFPAGHTLRRWDPPFAAGHAVYVARVDSQDRVWWCDPLAPKGTYNGQWVTKAQLAQFMTGGWKGITRTLLSAQPAPAPAPTTEVPMALATYTPGYIASLKGGKNVRSATTVSDATKARLTAAAGEKVTIVGKVRGAIPVGLTSPYWLLWYEKGVPVYIHESNATSVVAPAPAVDPNPALEADIAAKAAIINEQAALIASQKTDLAEAAARKARSDTAIDALKG